jgi:outer membrane protein TolC
MPSSAYRSFLGATLAWPLVALLSVAAARAETLDEDPPDPLTLAWCLERAARVNPELAMDAADAEAATWRVESAGTLEDPRLSYAASNVPIGEWDFDSTPLSGHQFFLRQKLPFPGLLRARKEAAEEGAHAARLQLADRQRRVAGRVESTWAELGFAQQALAITQRNIDLLRQLNHIAEVKYSVGTGLQQDVLRAQVELTALLEEQLQREAQRAEAAAELVALLDLPPRTRLPLTTRIEDVSALPELDPLLSQIEQTSPLLGRQTHRIEEARELERATRLEGYPDVDLGLGYRIRKDVSGDPVHGDDFVGADLTLRLPINRSKWRSQLAERRALVRREEARYRRLRAELHGRIRSAFAQLARADAESSLLETGLVPQARQSLEASRSGYEVGRIDFLSLLDSQVRLLDAELRHVRAATDRRLAYAALEAAVGETLR